MSSIGSPRVSGGIESTRALASTLTYRHPAVTRRFAATFEVDDGDVEPIFVDTLRWLWLCSRRHALASAGLVNHPLAILSGMGVLDEMWHTFLLFDAAYLAFCRAHLGSVILHAPVSSTAAHDPAGSGMSAAWLRWQIGFTIDELGADTATRWYAEYPRRFPTAPRRRPPRHATGSMFT